MKKVIDELDRIADEFEEAVKERKEGYPTLYELRAMVEDLHDIEQGRGEQVVDRWRTHVKEFKQGE